MGDFNYPEINWSTWSSDKDEQTTFVETIRDCFLFQHVSEPTRGRINNEPSLLDLIMSNEEGMITELNTSALLEKVTTQCSNLPSTVTLRFQNTKRPNTIMTGGTMRH